MEEVRAPEDVAPVGGEAQQEHALQILQISKEEQVKDKNGVEVLVGDVAASPQLFAEVVLGEESVVPDTTTKLQLEAMVASILPQDAIALSASIGNSGNLMDRPNGFGVLEEDNFAEPDTTLPLLPSLDDMSIPDAAASMIDSEPRVQAFAKLEFDDGQFYMNTWAVELGRDMRAAKKAQQEEFEEPDQPNSSASKRRSNSSADGGQGSIRRRDEPKMAASSVISETGGILNYGPEGPPKTSKPSRRKAKSDGSASQMISRSNSLMELAMETESVNPNDLLFSRSANTVQPVNPQTHLPSPDECPLIPIHPPATDAGAAVGHRGISRRHVKIQYSFERRLFEMEVKGRNGAFVDEIYYGAGEIAELRSRCYIQIGGVGIRFILPNVADGETGAEPTLASEAVSAMSFDFEDGRGEGAAMAEMSDSSSDPPMSSDQDRRGRQRKPRSSDGGSEISDDNDEPMRPSGGKKSQKYKKSGKGYPQPPKIKLRLKTTQKETHGEPSASPQESESPSAEMDEEALKALGIDVPISLIPPRRKGPGRPPKNGFMSKREEASLKKQAREAAKAQAVADGTLSADALISPTDFSGQRKFLKKENSREIHESIEDNDGSQAMLPPKIPKEKKPPKPPKSPSPFIDEATLTPEQLAKPQHSYVVMIHEALSNCPAGQMSLPQIYKAIERRYPYFKFKVTTPGWQSSIRHNLSQHPAFKKTETREGKGWMWCLDHDVSIEKEKRPRRPSPPVMTQPYYPQGPNMYRPSFPYPGMSQSPANGPVSGQFPYPSTASTATATQTAGGTESLPVPPAGANASYQSPYGASAGKANQQGAQHSQPVPAPAAANPYLLAQTMHHQPRPSPQGTNNTQNPHSRGGLASSFSSQGASNITAQALTAITRYKATLMGSLSMANRELIIDAAINKVLGRPVQELTSIGDRTAAMAIEKPLIGLLQQVRESEQQNERQQLSQTPTTPAQNTGIAPAPTASHPLSVSGQNPLQPPSVSPAQSTATNQILRAGNGTSSELPTPTTTQSLQPSASTAVLSTSHSSQAVTPTASPITPVQTTSPSTAPPVTALASTQNGNKPASTVPAPSSKADDQKQLLSILSQLGTSNPATLAGSTKSTNGGSQHDEMAKSTRGTKRALDHDEDTNTTNSKDIPIDGNPVKDHPRAAKRVAI